MTNAYLTLFYKGQNNSNEIFEANYDGSQWGGNISLGDVISSSAWAPGLAALNNHFYLGCKGLGNDNRIYINSFNGINWSPPANSNPVRVESNGVFPLTSQNPSIITYNGYLFMVVNDYSTKELYYVWFDGRAWHGYEKITITTGGQSQTLASHYNPGICVFNGKVYITYALQNNYINCAWFNGREWEGGGTISADNYAPLTNYSPGMAVFKDKLYILYKGYNNTNLYYSWFDGTTWNGNLPINVGNVFPMSDYCPNAVVYNDMLYMAYKNAATNDMYVAWFDGSVWYGNQSLHSMGVKALSNYPPGMMVLPGLSYLQNVPYLQTWMMGISDATPIDQINIPGTHDSASINKYVHSAYACQGYSITNQLRLGIRLLDVRLKVLTDPNGNYSFVTCHGHIGYNEYQTFVSLLQECKSFLTNNSSETIIMSLKIDDYNGVPRYDYSNVYSALENVLANYPTAEIQSTIPTLGSIRGKIFLYNRINNGNTLGVPLHWTNNTEGESVGPINYRQYSVFVQDRYEDLSFSSPEEDKTNLVLNAFAQKTDGMVVWNFASATSLKLFGVYIMPNLIQYFGQHTPRPVKFGWTLFDYPTNLYNTTPYGFISIIQVIVSSNDGYAAYPESFQLVENIPPDSQVE